MFPIEPPMARNALRILCHHFGYEPNYEEVQALYLDICDQVAAHRLDGGKHTVDSLLLQIMADTVRQYVEPPLPTQEP